MKLVIAEKPSVAQSIAAVLGATKRQNGYWEGGGWIVSWCYGHLVELAAPAAYGDQFKHWSLDTLPILPEHWKYEASKNKAKQLSVLRGLMNRADVESIVCATDVGREGQLIFQLAFDYCKCSKPVQRLWISSMEDSAIREGFANLRPGAEYDSLYRSALCRSQADWLVGINATRLFSCLYGGKTLNVGRVQSPTLTMIVGREEAIRGFASEPFYTPEIDCGQRDAAPILRAAGTRAATFEAADAIRSAADGRDALVLSVEKANKTAAPPKLYDLTTLQREANRLFGFTAQQTLDYAQSLYEKKLITYPRTDSRFLTGDMEDGLEKLVNQAATLLPFIQVPVMVNTVAVINSAKVSDHHAIIPTMETKKTDLTALPSGELAILQMLVVRLVCAVAPAHTYEAVTAVLECGGYNFTARGRNILQDGWKDVDNAYRAALKNNPEEDTEEEDGTALPELKKGQVFRSVSVSVREGATSPPKRYTEDTLLSAMETAGAEDFHEGAERKGLGTPATRAAIIEKLIKSGFIKRQKKALIPTDLGINLIAILPETIKSPLLTAEWEQLLKAVEKGELTAAAFMDGIAGMTRKLVEDHPAPIDEYKTLFATAPGNDDLTKRGTGPCPRCGSSVVERQKGFFCSSRVCKFALWKDNRFFTAKKKKLTKTVAAALLNEGRVFFPDLYSEKTGKTYAAAILLEDTGDKTNFKLDFEKGRDNQ